MTADQCRRGNCSHYYLKEPLTQEMSCQYGFMEDGEIDWLPRIRKTPMSAPWRQHLTNRALDPSQFIARDDDAIVFFTHKVDEMAGVAVARIFWSPLAVQLDVETTATGGARIVKGVDSVDHLGEEGVISNDPSNHFRNTEAKGGSSTYPLDSVVIADGIPRPVTA
ncbi:hypothetical protein FZI85_17355 [Mycobacterium sp. CBMA293]|uniref:hypothetical protein n=1 Tax=unclassified Mycolicibacterium TaxID=2636767 RepID=UPI0012DE051A|nr:MULTISPECIES: hypothetical protein [unclassified Mycolicibacterium]MUL44490.1 hypothetical protein [Mycolicibacterium sp. CBMA 360]MUL59810.1 hypothetical protein [Mycolicibacterium sp. CBMA 335]MUL68653.1 hypothetical protein [Mycolicibacterium sp. CBMA 311]MUL93956.1 hypothetical protein [Mycolicibacterium sp. CBMA 230]MUM06202.1 hypothetical protein [Mycolicibacterium sp. CBMA 213]